MKTPPADDTPIEKALERVERLAQEMESGKLTLEEVIARFEEGSRLVKACQEKLEAAERKIQIIVRDASGEAALEEFEEESA